MNRHETCPVVDGRLGGRAQRAARSCTNRKMNRHETGPVLDGRLGDRGRQADGCATLSLRAKPPLAKTYRMAAVRQGDVTEVVKSSGTVQPVQSVQVGSFVSGPISHIYVNFNAEVKKGQLLATIDELIPKANLAQAKAALASAQANLLQADAKLEQTKRDWKRAQDLLPKKAIADSDYDLSKSAYETAVAGVAVARATIEQCDAAVAMAETNLGYTKIVSPVDGIVTDRKVDPGQTLASTYQTPVLFVVAPDLKKRVYVLASVDEADIGMIRDAQGGNSRSRSPSMPIPRTSSRAKSGKSA